MGSQMTWNYEKQMGVGYLWAMLPIIRKLYKDPADQKEMMKHMFNSLTRRRIWVVSFSVSTLRQKSMRE